MIHQLNKSYSCCSNCWRFSENINFDPDVLQLNVCSKECVIEYMNNFGDFIELKRKEKILERHPALQESGNNLDNVVESTL